MLLPKDPNDEKNVIVEIRGGQEAEKRPPYLQEISFANTVAMPNGRVGGVS